MDKALRSVMWEWWAAESPPLPRLLCGGATLAFLAYPLADVLSGRLAGFTAVVAAAGLAAFSALYLRLFWRIPELDQATRRLEGPALVLALAAIAVALAIGVGNVSGTNDSWEGPLVYVTVAAALALPMRLALPGVLIAALTLAIAGGFGSIVFQALFFGLLLVMVRGLATLVAELDAARAQVANLAVNEERLRLSRDLHDLLGHNLSVIVLKSELARRLMEGAPEAAANEVRDVESVARQSLQEAREAVRGLRRASLSAELDRARDALEAASIEVTVRTAGPLAGRTEAVLGSAVREASTNVLRHSGARHCELVVRRVNGDAELEVRDDGSGPPDSVGNGSGLRGLAERLAEAGGTLDVGAAPGGGFRVTARVPETPVASP